MPTAAGQDMGYEQSSILGKPLEELVADSSRESFSRRLFAVLSGSQVDNLESADSARATDESGSSRSTSAPCAMSRGT